MTDSDAGYGERTRHTWYCWCEEEDCDWELEITNADNEQAQNITGTRMIAHGIKTGHHDTRRKEVTES